MQTLLMECVKKKNEQKILPNSLLGTIVQEEAIWIWFRPDLFLLIIWEKNNLYYKKKNMMYKLYNLIKALLLFLVLYTG